ncbi:hypothetical protein [Streptomyces sp. AM 2-1-1]|uniref:hypothetical protein n=1 Tax=Streptomyces sp. AM 2-1-1 TaxID=3028709 RepID=UPI0023B8B000|nr:hypothetical protein [Streptomyces sp. AM 2-1-1]WEH38205.1 hypothetical protein PZB77_01040 [Streptomyces sp. AM 2-1-1]
MLFRGPDESEEDAGFWSELPDGKPAVEVEADGRQVRVRLGTPVGRLSTLARLQLVCTAAHLGPARTSGVRESVRVTVRGSDGSMEPSVCPL